MREEKKVKVKISKGVGKEKRNKESVLKEEEIVKIEEKLKSKKVIPQKVKEEVIKKQSKNLVICLLLMALVCLFHLGCLNIQRPELIVDMKFFAIVVLVVSIILFEKAYKKDNRELCIHGIEILVFAIYILFLPYIYFSSGVVVQIIFIISPLYFGIYYCAKGILIEAKAKKEHDKSLSDVKEITKKERKK